MNSYWKKFFTDGTSITGTDKDTEAGTVSWRRTRNTDLCGVEMAYKGKIVDIKGIGDYWQADSYSVDFMESYPNLLARRVEKKINNTDLFITKESGLNRFTVTFSTVPNPFSEMIYPELLGKWFYISVDSSGCSECGIRNDK